jgi:L-rhamnose-H+ transport protein
MPAGFLIVIFSGVSNGSFAVPMKRMRGWAWEHSWLVWALSALVIVPLVAALSTIPRLWEVYTATSWNSIGLTALFGFLWGISAIMFGLGIDRMGLAIGYGIVIGVSSALGALGPLLAKHSDQLLTRTGLLTVGGVLLMVLGVAGCAVAGRLREKSQERARRASLVAGLVFCVASGAGAPLLNFGLVYGSEIMENVRRTGAADTYAANAVWPLLLPAAFLANAFYCGYLITSRSGWRTYVEVRPFTNVSLGLLMGLLWMGGLLLYGVGSRMLGPLGLVLGWPVMMGLTVLTANAWGAVTGEWRGTSRSAKLWMLAGVVLMIAGVGVIGHASQP